VKKYFFVLSLIIIFLIVFSYSSMLHLAGLIDVERIIDIEKIEEVIDRARSVRVIID